MPAGVKGTEIVKSVSTSVSVNNGETALEDDSALCALHILVRNYWGVSRRTGAAFSAFFGLLAFVLMYPVITDRSKRRFERKEKRNSQIVEAAQALLDVANKSLKENQKVLFRVVDNPGSARYSAGSQLTKLRANQADRGSFSEHKQLLTHLLTGEGNEKIRGAMQALIECASSLQNAFYRNHDESIGAFGLNSPQLTKHYVEIVLGKRGKAEGLEDSEVARIASEYLEFLRGQVDRIGSAVGTLKAELHN